MIKNKDKAANSTVGVIVTGIVSILTVMLNAYMSFLNNQDKAQLDQLADLQEEVRLLRTERKDCANDTFSLKHELLTCYAAQTVEQNRRVLLESFIDNLPLVAWVKRVEVDKSNIYFTMDGINKAYETKYNVSRHRYIGNTDSHMWPAEVADAFNKSDLRVWNRKLPIKVVEKIPKEATQDATTEAEEVTVVKWLINIGNEYWVAGLLLEE